MADWEDVAKWGFIFAIFFLGYVFWTSYETTGEVSLESLPDVLQEVYDVTGFADYGAYLIGPLAAFAFLATVLHFLLTITGYVQDWHAWAMSFFWAASLIPTGFYTGIVLLTMQATAVGAFWLFVLVGFAIFAGWGLNKASESLGAAGRAELLRKVDGALRDLKNRIDAMGGADITGRQATSLARFVYDIEEFDVNRLAAQARIMGLPHYHEPGHWAAMAADNEIVTRVRQIQALKSQITAKRLGRGWVILVVIVAIGLVFGLPIVSIFFKKWLFPG